MSGIQSYFTPTNSNKRNRSQSSPELLQNIKKMPKSGEQQNSLADITKQLCALTVKMGELATKEDIQLVLTNINSLREENKNLKEKITDLERQNKEIKAKLSDLENRGRRNNLVFHGLRKDNENDWVEVIRNFCVGMLGVREDVWINRAHPLGRNTESVALIAHFPDDRDINFILKNSRKLKGTNYRIYRDFSLDTRLARGKLFAIKKEIKRVSVASDAFVVQDKLIVQGNVFKIDEGELRCGMEDGIKQLATTLKCELKDLCGVTGILRPENAGN